MIEIKVYSPEGVIVLDKLDDKSYRYQTIMGQHNVTVYVSKSDALRISIGSYLDFQGIRYTLERPENIKKNNTRNLEYTIIFESPQAKLSKYKIRNTVDKRLKFPFTARPKEHLQLIVDNLNMRDSGWTIGECVDAVESIVNYNHTFCSDALQMIADAFKTEWEVKNKVIHLKKVEYNKNYPLALSYGDGNGFKTGVSRTNIDNSKAIEVLYVQGGERNIDFSKYKSKELLLPKGKTLAYDGVFFEDQKGFNPDNARSYKTDADGYFITRADKELKTYEEDSLDCSHIYPSRVGVVTKVQDDGKGNYDIFDSTIPANLNYSDYRIDGEKITIIFQSGMLITKEFDLVQNENKVTGYVHAQRKFMLVSQEYDGQTMPNDIYIPRPKSDDYPGDQYAVFGMMLPDEYICNDETKSGASWDMFREAIKYFFENEESRFAFSGELDGLWSKQDWLNIGGKLVLGGYVLFTDNQLQYIDDIKGNNNEGVLIRITGIKDYLNNPYSPEITLANVTAATYNSDLRKISENEVVVDTNNKNTINYVKRSWRGAMELISKLYDPSGSFQQNLVSSLAVQAMVGLFGDKLLQFSFWDSSFTKETEPIITFDKSVKQLSCNKAYVRHDTLGFSEDTLSGKKKTDYRYWNIEPFPATVLDNPDMFYYLYLKVSKSATENPQGLSIGTGSWYISADPIEFEGDTDNYYLWVASLNSEENGDRQITNMYGLSEITPNMLRINNIASVDGNNYFKLLTNQFRMGDNKSSIEWNKNNDGRLAVKGSVVVSPSGDESLAEVDRGGFNSTKTYFVGDKIWYSGIAYVCISNAASTGTPDKDSSKWKPYAPEVTIGGVNLLRDSSFEKGIGGSANVNKSTITRIDGGYNGSYCMKTVSSDNTASGYSWGSLPTVAGKEYTVSCYVKADTAISGATFGAYTGAWQSVKTKSINISTEWSRVDITFTATGTNMRMLILKANVTFFVDCVQLEESNKVSAWSINPDDIHELINDVEIKTSQAQQAATNAQNSIDSLNSYVDGAFKDGVISQAEAIAIETHLKNVNDTMSQLEATYNKLYINPYLEGAAKNTLLNTKVNLFGARDNLIKSINDAIADGKTTVSEKNNVNSKYDLFNDAIKSFNTAIEDSNRAIQDKLDSLSSDKINSLQIGSVNLIDNSARIESVGGDGVDNYEKIKFTNLFAYLVEGEEYTFQCKTDGVWGSGNGNIDTVEVYLGLNRATNPGEYVGVRTIPYTFKAPKTGKFYIRIDSNKGSVKHSFWEFQLEKGNKATDWKLSNNDIQNGIEEAQSEAKKAQQAATNAQTSVNNLNTYVDGAFKDGVISEAEAVAIATHLNNVGETMAQLEATYNKLYANPYIEGTAKTSLLNAKISLFGARDNLVSTINTAIADNKVTTTEKNNVNSKYDLFNSAITTFNGAVEDANKAIQTKLDAISKGYADAAKKIADEAQKAADKAQETAQESKDRLNEWAKDSVISPTEKTALRQQAEDVKSEYQEISAQAARYNLTTTTEWAEYYSSYTKAIAAFGKYTSVNPENITIESDYSDIAVYYSKRQIILDLVATKSKAYADELVSNLQIGGVNLIDNSQPVREVGGAGTSDKEVTSWTGLFADLIENETYTFSCKTDAPIWGGAAGVNSAQAFICLDKQYVTYHAVNSSPTTFVCKKTGRYYVRIDSNKGDVKLSYWNFQLEKGNKATDWKPSENDIQKKIANAQADADKANGLLSDISNDNILTPNEKQDVLKEWDIIKSERSTVIAQAQNMGVNYSNYSVAYNDLSAYITPLLSSMTTNSAIKGSDFRTKFKNYYDAKIALLKDVTDKAKAISDEAKDIANNANTNANNALSEAQALDYLRKALAGSTTINGGLLLTSMIQLGIIDANKFIERAGINGTARNGSDVIAWFGGTLLEAVNNLASIVFRANGNAKIGQFDLIDGRLIGYKDGIERVQLTTDAIGDRRSLQGREQLFFGDLEGSISLDYTQEVLTILDFSKDFYFNVGDTIIPDLMYFLYKGPGTGMKEPSNQELRVRLLRNGVVVTTFTPEMINSGNGYTITQAGTYTIHWDAWVGGNYSDERDYYSGTYLGQYSVDKVTSARKSVLASDGFASVWDETKYFMLSATQGYFLEAKGTMKLSTPDGQQSIILDSKGIKFEGIDGKNKGKGYLYVDSGNTLKLGT